MTLKTNNISSYLIAWVSGLIYDVSEDEKQKRKEVRREDVGRVRMSSFFFDMLGLSCQDTQIERPSSCWKCRSVRKVDWRDRNELHWLIL